MSALHPQPPFMQGDAVLAVQPFGVSVPQLVEAETLEASGDGKLAEPAIDGDVDSIRRGVADNEAGPAAWPRRTAQCLPDAGQVEEVVGDHHVVLLLAAVVLLLGLQPADRRG